MLSLNRIQTSFSADHVRTETSEAGPVICPACHSHLSCSTGVQFTQYSRGERVWRRCLLCWSFFDPEKYDPMEEVLHTKTRPWGRPDSGKRLNDFKMRMFRNVLALLLTHCPPPATLLDVGCSYGGFLIEARKAGYRVAGSDIVPEAIEYLRTLDIPAQQAFSIGDVSLIKDGMLDILTCLDCNCLWPDQPLQLRHALTKLKPGGFLAMRVVDKSWMFALGLKIHRVMPKLSNLIMMEAVNDHRFSMPVSSLVKVIRSVGFEVLSASPYGAMHSDKTRWPVKLSFAVGCLLWEMAGLFMAPGAVVLARKPVP